MPLTASQRKEEMATAQRIHDEAILGGISFSRDQGMRRMEFNLRRFLAVGTQSEKAEYAAAVGGEYRLPGRIAVEASDFQKSGSNDLPCRAKRCIQYGSEEVCNNRVVCNLVCAGIVGGAAGAGGGVAGGVAGAIGGAECSRVCQTIPQCRTVTFCAQYEYSGPGCF